MQLCTLGACLFAAKLVGASALSRPSALRPNVVNQFFVFCGLSQFWMRKEGWGDVLWSFTMARKPCFIQFDVVV